MTNKEIVVGGFLEAVNAALGNILGNLAGMLFALMGVSFVGVGIRNVAECCWRATRSGSRSSSSRYAASCSTAC
jgi:hypothetical protein